MRSSGTSDVLQMAVPRLMGKSGLIRSENSLNQHLKLKHMELWEQLKNEVAKSENENSGKEDKMEG